jgi:hypothetical protein
MEIITPSSVSWIDKRPWRYPTMQRKFNLARSGGPTAQGKKARLAAHAALLLFRRTLFLALFAAADVATPIPHFVSFEVRNLIDML